MASATNQITLPGAFENAKEGKIKSPNTILKQRFEDIWQRVQAQPSTYMLTEEEFSVLLPGIGDVYDNKIGRQAIRRYWNHVQTEKTDIPDWDEGKEIQSELWSDVY